MDETTAVLLARKLLKDANVTTAPIDVEALAQSLGFQISRKELDEGEAGFTLIRREKKYICVNQQDSVVRQRFTILHEIAHHVLDQPSKHEKVPSDELERFTGRPPEEILCDIFAAECLVPWQLIQPLAEQKDFTLEHLTELAEQFQASRSCIASRFAQASNDHLAFVVTEDGIIKYSIVSKALKASRVWISKNVVLPKNSAAAKALKSGVSGLHEADTEGLDWSNSDDARRFACYEQATYYAPTKQTQSIIIFDELEQRPASAGYRAADDNGGLLEELDGYPGWSKPRY
ncbi:MULTISPECIES: ImmA/IrrE family metallo-endopeptidase [Pseudomonas]|uniref:ImmA/IrrE family metallo-endopeptidase n=1 Tax=Pseudomonas extremaustralis TaxID=359110 RepID=A0A5C5Q3N2_9PSED|nr:MULTISPECIES: ImmA/IrrE family metallo-endopeptidase [Pseudomonas]EZI23935.1 peptidase [Pseudomonas extremaustralis 14-3 substr. 14-3b]PMU26606.1 ImmA/IrrE family metallo-endopeptidase [Pseudomonas sp. GP01-A9]PMU31841.1 ImmA/IrrE family metallo-endopeptidase [Pseudomonas sp. GP01-A13]PMU44040.1 ImmA/IrrE family metallo-endopeptidase [Pseudomonas sp. GP01-A8]PMU51309.1 ImmA/IrrE family metallo-endopeptidase [Pseudomonas sp. GP01-A6]